MPLNVEVEPLARHPRPSTLRPCSVSAGRHGANKSILVRVAVGIHVRHGADIRWHVRNLNHGHLSAPADYYGRAMQVMRDSFPDRRIIFIVAADETSWARSTLSPFELRHGKFASAFRTWPWVTVIIKLGNN